MTKIEAIKDFLSRVPSPLAKLYEGCMEVQVNVAKDGGEYIRKTQGDRVWRGWTDGTETWKAFRIPWNADTIPEYRDSRMSFDLFKHVEGIGMTGWDWENKVSRWVGYDFDSLVNHDAGMTEDQLSDLVTSVSSVEWVSLYKSTSGKGYHLYLFFDDPVPTSNHTEHAALARSLISLLTVETGFNFQATVDCVGSILWCYHRKQEGTDGLTCIKEGTKFPSVKVPSNWKEHTAVTSRLRKKTKVSKQLEILSSSIKHLDLDIEHQKILKWFSSGSSERVWWWDNDYNMLICHTLDLKKCHTELQLKGIFETISSGSSEQNCFCFPGKGGSFTVRRHGQNTREAATWIMEETGWSKCFFNTMPTFHNACVTYGGQEDAHGGYVFTGAALALSALKLLGIETETDSRYDHRRTFLKKKGSKIVIAINKDLDDPKPKDYLQERKHWVRVITHYEETEPVHAQESIVRHVISNGSEAGWYVNINNEWVNQTRANVVSVLISQMIGYKKVDIDRMMGLGILDPWTLVQKPFEEEYLSGRQWNKDAPQLAYTPVSGKFGTWLDLLSHLGSDLDDTVKNNSWCQLNNLSTGGEYLQLWIASMFQKPAEPLPYLFFFGETNSGKSTFHEAIHILFKNGRGTVKADRALRDKNGFNGELENAVLCVVEEIDLSKDRLAAERIKEWVTGRTISVRAMYHGAYDILNTTHWVQCSNFANYVLILRGDTRIVAVNVSRPAVDIPKNVLLNRLRDEAPAFLYEILNTSLPDAPGRLSLPCLETSVKREMMSVNATVLERFLEERTKVCTGHVTTMRDLYDAFKFFCLQREPEALTQWTLQRVSIGLPRCEGIVRGTLGRDKAPAVGNLTLDLDAVPSIDSTYKLNNGELIYEKIS